MAAAVQTRLQPPHSRAQAAPWQSARHALSSASCRGSWGRGWSPSLPLPPPLVAAAARAAVVCQAAGPAPSQAAEPQPDKEPKKPFSWVGLLQALAVALLSPILFPAYILLVDPLDPEEAPRPKSKPKLPGNLVHIVFHLVALTALMAVAEALCAFTGPAWAEAAANTLLGNGRVAEVLTACSLLAVPRSPTMQLCTICAIYAYYRCVYHFEAWHAARYPERKREDEEEAAASGRSAVARREADRVTRRVFGPRFRALWWVVMFIGGPNKWMTNWIASLKFG